MLQHVVQRLLASVVGDGWSKTDNLHVGTRTRHLPQGNRLATSGVLQRTKSGSWDTHPDSKGMKVPEVGKENKWRCEVSG
jgi:hypothetical protein